MGCKLESGSCISDEGIVLARKVQRVNVFQVGTFCGSFGGIRYMDTTNRSFRRCLKLRNAGVCLSQSIDTGQLIASGNSVAVGLIRHALLRFFVERLGQAKVELAVVLHLAILLGYVVHQMSIHFIQCDAHDP